jgi:hypothetical protein
MDLLFANYISSNKEAFLAKVVSISAKLGIEANWLMAIMYKESTMNPRAVNSTTGATGLIQFMPNTAQGLGTTTAAILNMTNLQQLDYVFKYFYPYRNRMTSYIDAYLAVFFPAAIGKPDDWVFQAAGLSAAKVASQNKGVDVNKDGVITKAEFAVYAYKYFAPAIVEILKKKP